MDSPVGVIAVTKDLLRTTLASCTAFREWDGNDWSVDEAKARIYLDALPPPADGDQFTAAELIALRPFAIVYKPVDDGVRAEHEAVAASSRSYKLSGTLIVRLDRNFPDVDEEDDPESAADRSFENMVGLLIKSGNPAEPGLLELSGDAGFLAIRSLREYGPYRVDPKDVNQLGDFQSHFLVIDWGRA